MQQWLSCGFVVAVFITVAEVIISELKHGFLSANTYFNNRDIPVTFIIKF